MKLSTKLCHLALLITSLLAMSCATADVRSEESGGRLDDQVPDLPEDDTMASDMGQDQPADAGDLPSDPTTDPAVDPTTDPRPDPIADPVADTATDPTVDPRPDPVVDPVSDPITEPDATQDPDLPTGGGLFISEICDHKSSPGASFIEVYNATGFPLPLAGWSLERWVPSSTQPTVTYFLPDVSLPNGATYVVANRENDFFRTFARTADVYFQDAEGVQFVTGTGDDHYVLVYSTTDVDVWGVPGMSDSLIDWDYANSVAKRNPGILIANSTWQLSEWTITVDDTSTANPGFRN